MEPAFGSGGSGVPPSRTTGDGESTTTDTGSDSDAGGGTGGRTGGGTGSRDTGITATSSGSGSASSAGSSDGTTSGTSSAGTTSGAIDTGTSTSGSSGSPPGDTTGDDGGPGCGNGVIQPPEDCDCGMGMNCIGRPAKLQNLTCADFDSPAGTPFGGGTLGCRNNCTFDVSACVFCGDDIRDEGEDCDGADLGAATCEDAGFLGGGSISCGSDCSFETSGCMGPMCGEAVPPTPPGACPEECTGGCTDFTCTVLCDEDDECEDSVIACPDNWDCDIQCAGADDTCKQSTINCPTNGACRVACHGSDACEDATLNCGDGVCEVDCSSARDACDGLDVACGSNRCASTCDFGDVSEAPTLACGSACGCAPCL